MSREHFLLIKKNDNPVAHVVFFGKLERCASVSDGLRFVVSEDIPCDGGTQMLPAISSLPAPWLFFRCSFSASSSA